MLWKFSPNFLLRHEARNFCGRIFRAVTCRMGFVKRAHGIMKLMMCFSRLSCLLSFPSSFFPEENNDPARFSFVKICSAIDFLNGGDMSLLFSKLCLEHFFKRMREGYKKGRVAGKTVKGLRWDLVNYFRHCLSSAAKPWRRRRGNELARRPLLFVASFSNRNSHAFSISKNDDARKLALSIT